MPIISLEVMKTKDEKNTKIGKRKKKQSASKTVKDADIQRKDNENNR